MTARLSRVHILGRRTQVFEAEIVGLSPMGLDIRVSWKTVEQAEFELFEDHYSIVVKPRGTGDPQPILVTGGAYVQALT